MVETRVRASAPRGFTSLLQVRPHHLRSVQIERDFADPAATLHYVITPFVRSTAARLATGFADLSTARAWRLTGDYGSGKSSFALALARLAGGRADLLPEDLRDLAPQARFEPVLIVGEREPVGVSVLRGLRSAVERHWKRPQSKLAAMLDPAGGVEPQRIVAAVEAVRARFSETGIATGILLVLDELGKNLEAAATEPDASDVYLLQHLAETAARSGSAPIMIVAIVHQAVASYAAGLSSSHRREWEKVAGRYEEVVFAPPLEQSATLVAAALDVDLDATPPRLARAATRTMGAAVRLGWFGAGAARTGLVDLAPALLPLDPMVLPVIARAMRRFGQNERSIFSFLSSTEPHGLMSHAEQPVEAMQPYRLHDLFDYMAANFATLLSTGPGAARWTQIEEILRSAALATTEEKHVLKTVALLNLLDDPALPATRDVVALAVAGDDRRLEPLARAAIERLSRGAHVLYDRGASGALCLWPHTSVDLEDAFIQASAAIEPTSNDLEAIGRLARSEPIVARRHYVERGTLRHFDITCLPGDDFEKAVAAPIPPGADAPDGRVFLVLTRTEQERSVVWEKLSSCTIPGTTLVGVPRPVGGLAPMLRDVAAWRWVRDHVPALAGDRIARTEANRQLASAEGRLARALGSLLDVRGAAAGGTRWRDAAGPLSFASGRAFMARLSDLCDAAFRDCPRVHNELINRRTLSSAAARARHQLVEALATASDRPGLGIPCDGTPPERAIYLSVIEAGGVHVLEGGRWRIRIPSPNADPLLLAPSLKRVGDVLRAADGPVPYERLAAELRGPGFGMRDGLIPLLLAIYLRARWNETAVYEEGTYLDQVGGPEFTRIVKEPEHFEFQHCAIEGVRADVYARLGDVLGTPIGEVPALLDVVRPLITFAAKQLPDHARRTRRLDLSSAAAREVLLSGRDPSGLLFDELPAALGIEPFPADATAGARAVDRYVQALSAAVRDLNEAYPRLLGRIAATLGASLEAGSDLATIRPPLIRRATSLLAALAEPELKAFVLRLADTTFDDRGWLESVASLIARKPPERWTDADEDVFNSRLPFLARRFRQVEAIKFPGQEEDDNAYRLVVTCADGRQTERVYRTTAREEQAIGDAQAAIEPMLSRLGRAGRIAAARLLLAADGDDPDGGERTATGRPGDLA